PAGGRPGPGGAGGPAVVDRQRGANGDGGTLGGAAPPGHAWQHPRGLRHPGRHRRPRRRGGRQRAGLPPDADDRAAAPGAAGAPVMLPTWWGAVLGLGLGTGVLLLWAGVPMNRRVDLADRIEPYLDRAPRRSRLLRLDDPRPWHLADVVAPLTRRAATLLDRTLGGTGSVRSRLHRAGLAGDVEAFRTQQVLWGIGACVLAAGLGSVLW